MSFVTGQILCNVSLLKPPFSSQLLEQILSWSVHRRLELLVGTVHHQMHEKAAFCFPTFQRCTVCAPGLKVMISHLCSDHRTKLQIPKLHDSATTHDGSSPWVCGYTPDLSSLWEKLNLNVESDVFFEGENVTRLNVNSLWQCSTSI